MQKKIPLILILSIFSLALVSSQIQIRGGQEVINLENAVSDVSTFLGLTDTPSSYSGQANNCVVVNAGETGLSFSSCGGGGNVTINGTTNFDVIDGKLVNLTTSGIDTTNINVTDNGYINKTLLIGTQTDLGGNKIVIEENHGTTTTIRDFFRLNRYSIGTPNDGMGIGFLFNLEDSAGVLEPAGRLLFKWSDESNGFVNFVLQLRNETADDLEDRLTLTENGDLNVTNDVCITGGNCLSSANTGTNFGDVFVNETGDTMTGQLIINEGNGRIVATNSAGALVAQTSIGSAGYISFGNTADIGISTDGVVNGYNYNGAYILKQKTSAPTAGGEFIFIEQSGDWRFALPKSQAGFGTYNPRSMIVAGASWNNESNFECDAWGFDEIDCDTGGTGADLGVQDDLQVTGRVYAENVSMGNVTLREITSCNGLTTNAFGVVGCNVITPTPNASLVFNTTDITYTGDKAVTHNISFKNIATGMQVEIKACGYTKGSFGGLPPGTWNMNIKNESGAIIGTGGIANTQTDSTFNVIQHGTCIFASDPTPTSSANYYLHLDETSGTLDFVVTYMGGTIHED